MTEISNEESRKILAEQIMFDNGIDPEKRRRDCANLRRTAERLKGYREVVTIAICSPFLLISFWVATACYSGPAMFWAARWLLLKAKLRWF
jgi:hypothetical protein